VEVKVKQRNLKKKLPLKAKRKFSLPRRRPKLLPPLLLKRKRKQLLKRQPLNLLLLKRQLPLRKHLPLQKKSSLL
jgi:hypothetical protein